MKTVLKMETLGFLLAFVCVVYGHAAFHVIEGDRFHHENPHHNCDGPRSHWGVEDHYLPNNVHEHAPYHHRLDDYSVAHHNQHHDTPPWSKYRDMAHTERHNVITVPYNNAERQLRVNERAEKRGASSGTARYYGVPGSGMDVNLFYKKRPMERFSKEGRSASKYNIFSEILNKVLQKHCERAFRTSGPSSKMLREKCDSFNKRNPTRFFKASPFDRRHIYHEKYLGADTHRYPTFENREKMLNYIPDSFDDRARPFDYRVRNYDHRARYYDSSKENAFDGRDDGYEGRTYPSSSGANFYGDRDNTFENKENIFGSRSYPMHNNEWWDNDHSDRRGELYERNGFEQNRVEYVISDPHMTYGIGPKYSSIQF